MKKTFRLCQDPCGEDITDSNLTELPTWTMLSPVD